MPATNSDVDFNSVISKLTEIPLRFREHGQTSSLKEFARLVRLATDVHTCSITFVNLKQKKVTQVAFSSENNEFEEYLEKKRELPLNFGIRIDFDGKFGVDFELASSGKSYECLELQKNGCKVSHPKIAQRYGLHSFYCYPIKIDDTLKGYINLFSAGQQPFTEEKKLLTELISKFAEIPIHQYETTKKYNKTLKEAIEEMAEVNGDNKRDKILMITLKYARKLIGKEHFSAILKLDDNTGELKEVEAIPPTNFRTVKLGRGYCSKALAKGDFLIEDVKSLDWETTYVDAWGKGTKTEMAIPLMIKNEQICVGKSTRSAFRPIAVLNFESPNLNEFTQEDVDILLPLVSQASLLIGKLATERKLFHLRETERKTTNKDWKDTLEIVANGIQDALGFEVVNISLVDYQRNKISTEIIVGLDSDERTEKFKQMASHSLYSNDIQAFIVKNTENEVPDDDDERFDKEIWKEFGHENLIRVFVPIISPLTNKCVGTIDAGYNKGHRKYIYENDVQILKEFADLAAEAPEKRRPYLLEKVFHELLAPIAGIEGHTDVLRNYFWKMSPQDIDAKLEEIELDCKILRYNMREAQYCFDKPQEPPRIEKVDVMRDIVIRTIKELKPRIQEKKFAHRNVKYEINDEGKIVVFIDRVQISQVVYNLLLNSIKYAQKNPSEFQIEVLTDEDEEFYVIKFRDWGFGIKEEYKERIFEDYFRAPEVERLVKGTGLGLPISRKIMKDIFDGDVVLVSLSKPTEFQVKIPKKLKEKPKKIG